MSKIQFDLDGKRYFETGVSEGVLFVKAMPTDTDVEDVVNGHHHGVAWNGLTAVTQSPEGAEASDVYADNIKYLTLRGPENLKATIEAYMYPQEFERCDGSASLGDGVKIGQQKRIPFAFVYKTKKGNDEDPDKGYIIHIIYGCTASPSEKPYATVNDSPEAITFSWEIAATPVKLEGFQPTAIVEIDSTKVASAKLTEIENALYGKDAGTDPSTEPEIVSHLLMPSDIKAIMDRVNAPKKSASTATK